MQRVVGFLPASGRGVRMNGELLIKEILPVKLPGMDSPFLLFENSLFTMKKAGVNSIVCTVNDNKPELIKYLNIYSQKHQMVLAYVYQNMNNDEYGVPYAIYQASSFLYGHTVVMRFPDTIVLPEKVIMDLLEFHRMKQSVLTLGVFSTKHPERLGPVQLSDDGKILRIQDKPKKPCAYNTWNCVIWEDEFLDVISELVIKSRNTSGKKRELLIYEAFIKCIEKNLPVYGMMVETGVCIDISSVKDFIQLWGTKDQTVYQLEYHVNYGGNYIGL